MRLWQIASPVRAGSAWPVALALAAAILLAMPTRSQADAEPKRIVMLHSFGVRFKPWTDYSETIRAEISRRARTPLTFHDHSLLDTPLQDDKSDRPFVDYLRALYEEKPPDLIIAFGAPAASFVQRYRDRLFPGTPMVFTAVEARRVQYDKLTENDAVVANRNDFAAAFENILQVLPDTKTIAIVNGVSANERFWEGELRRELAPFSRRVELKWFTDLPFEGILKNAANLPPHSAIFWHLMNVDAAGVAHETNTALNRLSASANAPIFSFLDVFFGEALVGGPMQSSRKTREAAAAVALRILEGEKAGDIKTPISASGRRASRTLPSFRYRIAARGFRRKSSKRFLSHFSPARPRGWAWGCPLRGPSWKPTADAYGPKIGLEAAHRFGSDFRSKRRQTDRARNAGRAYCASRNQAATLHRPRNQTTEMTNSKLSRVMETGLGSRFADPLVKLQP